AGGSGIAPLMAMVRDWQRAPSTPLLLVYSARTWDELAFRDELVDLQARVPAFIFVAATTRGAPQRAGDVAQRLDTAALHDILQRWGHVPRHAYVCGANRFVEAVASGLIAAHVPAAVIRTERYGGAG
ncbi:MAG: oxidoreductase, partial [Pseudomonadota bacterium]